MTDATPSPPPPAGIKLLVAEDDAGLRRMLQVVLTTEGYDVTVCPDGQAAIDLLASGERFAAVMVDLRMPRAGGDKVIAYIRGRAALRTLPVVAMSAFSDDLQARAMLDAGANAFLSKPFPIADLLSTLRQVLAEA